MSSAVAPPALLAGLGRLALSGSTAIAPASASVATALLGIGGLIMWKKIAAVACIALLLLLGGTAVVMVSSRRSAPEVASAPASPAAVPAERPRADGAAGDAAKEDRPAETKAASAPATDAAAISGTVLDVEGAPVQGALVVAAGADGKKLGEATAGDGGSFRIEVAPGTLTTLYAFKSASGLAVVPDVDAGASGIEAKLEPLASISGRVYDRTTGEGVAGIKIEFMLYGDAPDLAPIFAAARLIPALNPYGRKAVTGADGWYAAGDLGPSRFGLHFSEGGDYALPGFLGEDRSPMITLAAGAARTDVDFALDRGGSISGVVLGPDGAPIPGAKVQVVSSYHTFSDRPLGKSDESGAWRFRGLATNATYFIRAWRDGLAPACSERIALPGPIEVDGVEIHLVEGHTVRGRCVADDGAPIAGVDVYIADSFDRKSAHEGYPRATTAADGSFALERIPPGRREIHVMARDFETAEIRTFEMPDADLEGLQLVFKRKAGGTISGRVTDREGKPIADVRVLASAFLPTHTSGETQTGEDGTYRIEKLGMAERFNVDAYKDGYAFGRIEGVTLGATGADLVIARYGRVRGRALDATTGKPIPRFEVRAASFRPDPDGQGTYRRIGERWRGFDSAAGEFLCDEIEPFEVELEVRAPGYAPAVSPRYTVEPEETVEGVEVRLARGAALEGRVVDAAGGPIAGARVRLHDQDYFHSTLLGEREDAGETSLSRLTVSGADGRFAFDGLAPGSKVNLVAWMEGCGTVVLTDLAADGKAPLDIALVPQAVLRIDLRGAAVSAKSINVHVCHRKPGPWRSALNVGARPDEAGRMVIRALPPGRYRLSFYSQADRPGRSALLGAMWTEVAAGEEKQIDADLDELARKSGAVAAIVRGAPDASFIAANISPAGDPEDELIEGWQGPGADGRVRFGGLPPGEYIVRAIASPSRIRAEAKVCVGEGEAREVEVTFR
jgi:protocatechuate 3,4-dioxygenase beta subunit